MEQLKLSGHLTHNVNKVGNNTKTVSSVIHLCVLFKAVKVKKKEPGVEKQSSLGQRNPVQKWKIDYFLM